MKKYDIVVLGNSAAGLSFINTIRKYNKSLSVLLIDREEYAAYSRVLTPYYISGKTDRNGIFIVDKEYYSKINVDTILGEAVINVDFEKRVVTTDKRNEITYNYLFIGLGAEAKRTGFESDKILNLRHLDDADKLHYFFNNAKSVAGFGAGLVTIPLLSHMKNEIDKHLIISSDRVFSRVIDSEASQFVEEAMLKAGVKIYKKDDIVSTNEKNDKITITLKSGTSIDVDFAIIGKGVSQNIKLFEKTPLEIGWGIKVDKYCRTNIENVYAGGDIAQDFDFITKEDTTQGNWITAVEHGGIAAKHILSLNEAYEGSLKNNTTEVFGIEVAVVGYFKEDVKTVTYYNKQGNIFRKIFLDDDNTIIGCTMINETNDAGIYYGLVKRRVKFNEYYKPNKFYNFSKIHYATTYIE
ncbi:NAD(P)/FAD-dependent oxidoreductase [Deferribacter abyssi]|uniref:NAD(P)/FAD-dependent oxidoreductase n=1 Tax=Deferribacter abyssi TaxID=213806 RepID=UPI003C190FC0